MTRCHYGRERLTSADNLPVVGHPTARTCAVHAMLKSANTTRVRIAAGRLGAWKVRKP